MKLTKSDVRWYRRTGGLPVPAWEQAIYVTFFLMVMILLMSGCSSAPKLAADLAEFEKLGVSEIVITGKFSHTDYTVTHVNGVRRAEINHTNVWVPQIRVVRETKE